MSAPVFSDDRSASNGMNPDFLAFACADQAVPAVHVFFSASEPFINAFGEHECGAGRGIFFKMMVAFNDLRVEGVAKNGRCLFHKKL